MNDQVRRVQLLGRPLKPVALGVTILMIGLVVAIVFGLGYYDRDVADFVQAVPAAAAGGLLIAGWVRNSTTFTRWGLLVATFAYLERVVYIALVDPLGDSALLALGVLVIIAGSYILEAQDRGRIWTP